MNELKNNNNSKKLYNILKFQLFKKSLIFNFNNVI